MRAALPKIVSLLCVTLLGCGTAGVGTTPPVGSATSQDDPIDPRVRIRLHEAKLKADPTRYSDHAELGAAYLDMARETHDVAWLGKARKELERSIAIQPSANALATLASLCNFTHRFACALEHAERGARAAPKDGRFRALRIEAYLAQGELRKAEVLLDQPRVESGAEFVLPAARGLWLAEQRRFDQALGAFVLAAEQARNAQANDLAFQAEVNAAGAMLDSGRPGLARPHLQAARELLPASRPLQSLMQRHWAALHELEQRPDEALRVYESLLESEQDPELFRRACVVARQVGRTQRASELFTAAEQRATLILEAGEIFALETQALLYADAGVNLERAEKLARRNLEHKRDRRAYETLAYVRERRAVKR